MATGSTIKTGDANMADQLVRTEIVLGGDDHHAITARCADVASSTANLGLTNHFEYYDNLLSLLKSDQRFNCVAMKDILAAPKSGRINLALRHDIDADIVTATKCARKLDDAGLPGSFYVLHTSHYYCVAPLADRGHTHITRHKGVAYFLTALKETNAEIGIHNDALGLIVNHGIDGYRVLLDEIAWLRSEGLDITSSAAHNSAAVYGAECFEIFEGLAVGNRKEVLHNGKLIALQQLSANELGLEYEANFPVLRSSVDEQGLEALANIEGNALHTPSWQKQYFIDHPVFERGYDFDIWLIGQDLWLVAGAGNVQYPLTFDQMSKVLRDLPDRSRVVMTIHPIYVSRT